MTQQMLPPRHTSAAPGLLGLSHLGITVLDIAAAQRFWTQALEAFEEPSQAR